jgi:Na+-transporting NADH:ubiquinone oxidoreductase subunit NqrE
MELILKSLKSKTVQFSIALAALSILEGYIGFLPVGQATQAAIGVGIAVCIVVLRSVTTVALGQK